MRAVRTIVAVAAAVAGAATLHTSTGAYTTYARWASSPVTFYVNPVNQDVSQAAAVAALQAGMDVWNTQAGTLVPLPVRRSRHRYGDGLRQPQRHHVPQHEQRVDDCDHLLVVVEQQRAARQRHRVLGRHHHVLHGRIGLRRRVERGLHGRHRGARTRPRARPESLDRHRRHDVSELQLLLDVEPDAGRRRHQRREGALSDHEHQLGAVGGHLEPGQRRQLRNRHRRSPSPARRATRRTVC